MTIVSPTAKAQFIDATGAPLVAGLVYTYAAGTTTPLATYVDSTGATANTNPIVLDSRGEANIWLGGNTYKFKLCDSNNVEIWTVDNISAPTSALSPTLSGNVLINSSSSNAALTINQIGTGARVNIENTNLPNTSFVVDTYGNVGIQNSSPATALDIGNGGVLQLSNGGTVAISLSGSSTNGFVSSPGSLSFTAGVLTPQIVIQPTSITAYTPIALPGVPTIYYQAANKQYVDSVGVLSSPPGVIAPYAGTTAPTGWLLCDGSAISRSTYAALFANISTTWGAGNGTTTFNIPDLRGMFLRGTGTNGTIGGAIGPAVGASQTDTYLNHSHNITDPTHTHDMGVVVGINGGGAGAVPYPQTGSATKVTTDAQATGISVNTSTTGGTETRPKNYGVLYIIKT